MLQDFKEPPMRCPVCGHCQWRDIVIRFGDRFVATGGQECATCRPDRKPRVWVHGEERP